MKKNIVEYDVLRVLLTLIVVIGHCAYVVISSKYGGIDYEYMIKGSCIQFLINVINYVIYTFHMPCFIALSGAIYSMQVHKEKIQPFGVFVMNKFKRLIIPFFAVGLIFSIPLKYVAGYWENSENMFKDIVIGQFLLQGNTYLWFLACLFSIFLIFWVYANLENNRIIRIIMDGAIILIAVVHIPTKFYLVNNVLNYAIWFWCGYKFEQFREKFNSRLNIKISFAVIITFLAMAGIDMFFRKGLDNPGIVLKYARNIYGILMAVTGSVALYSVSYMLSKGKLPKLTLFSKANSASFGIYLYSDPLNYVIMFAFSVLFTGMNVEIMAGLLFVSRFLLTLLVSYIITVIIKKCGLKYLA